jgi:hypothetical protein
MNETPFPDRGSFEAQIDDEAIQRGWDRFAMADFSVDPELRGSRRAPTRRSSTNANIAVRGFDTLPAYNATTALGGAFARTESTDLADENTDAPDDRAEF